MVQLPRQGLLSDLFAPGERVAEKASSDIPTQGDEELLKGRSTVEGPLNERFLELGWSKQEVGFRVCENSAGTSKRWGSECARTRLEQEVVGLTVCEDSKLSQQRLGPDESGLIVPIRTLEILVSSPFYCS
jgi:hypothetical protein